MRQLWRSVPPSLHRWSMSEMRMLYMQSLFAKPPLYDAPERRGKKNET